MSKKKKGKKKITRGSGFSVSLPENISGAAKKDRRDGRSGSGRGGAGKWSYELFRSAVRWSSESAGRHKAAIRRTGPVPDTRFGSSRTPTILRTITVEYEFALTPGKLQKVALQPGGSMRMKACPIP